MARPNEEKADIMKNGRFFIPREQIYSFFNPEMNDEEGLYLCWETDPDVSVLPSSPAVRALGSFDHQCRPSALWTVLTRRWKRHAVRPAVLQ